MLTNSTTCHVQCICVFASIYVNKFEKQKTKQSVIDERSCLYLCLFQWHVLEKKET